MREALRRHRYVLLAAVAIAVVGAAVASGRVEVPGRDREPLGRLGPSASQTEDVQGYAIRKSSYLERLAVGDPDAPAAALVSLAAPVDAARAFELGSGGRVDVLYVVQDGAPASLVVSGSLEDASAALGEGCGCVYAFVLHSSTVGRLVPVQRNDAVRLVDVPEPLTDDLRGWELVPLVPEGLDVG